MKKSSVQLLSGLLVLVLVSAILLSCQSSKPEPTESPLTIPVSDSPVPPPPDTETVAQIPIQITQVPLVAPTPKPGKAVVMGVLLRDSYGMPIEPMTKIRLYLGSIILSSSGGRVVVNKPERDPLTFTNEDGSFFFTDIEPGTYGLIVVTPLGSVLMKHQDTGEEVVFTVEAGDVHDLGELHFLSEF